MTISESTNMLTTDSAVFLLIAQRQREMEKSAATIFSHLRRSNPLRINSYNAGKKLLADASVVTIAGSISFWRHPDAK